MVHTFHSPGMLLLQSDQCVVVCRLDLHQGLLMVLKHLLNLDQHGDNEQLEKCITIVFSSMS